jgi:hypothetical protein
MLKTRSTGPTAERQRKIGRGTDITRSNAAEYHRDAQLLVKIESAANRRVKMDRQQRKRERENRDGRRRWSRDRRWPVRTTATGGRNRPPRAARTGRDGRRADERADECEDERADERADQFNLKP